MARPLMGEERRSEVISVRITKAQKHALEMVFGKAAEGLHALLTIWMRGPRT